MSNIEIPEFEMPKFDIPKFDMPDAIKLNKLMNDVENMRKDYANHPVIDSMSNEQFEHVYTGYKIEVFLNILECALTGLFDMTINYKKQIDNNVRARLTERLVKELEEMKYEVDASKDGMYMRIKWEDESVSSKNDKPKNKQSNDIKSESIAQSVKRRRSHI